MFLSTLCAPLVALSAYTAGVLAIPAVSDTSHPLPSAYDFTRSGTGGYSIESSNLFTHADTSGTPKDFYPNVEDIANAKLSRDLAVSHPLHEPLFQSCTPVQKETLRRAVGSARRYTAIAIDYLQTPGPKPAYKRWFGTYNADRASTVEKVFTNVRSRVLTDFTFACDCTDVPLPMFRLDIPSSTIHLCVSFWYFPSDGSDDSQAQTIIRTAASLDEEVPLDLIAAGRAASQELARGNPVAAILNIDSYPEFVTTVANLTIVPDEGEDEE